MPKNSGQKKNSTAISAIKNQKALDIRELLDCEKQYSSLFKVLHANQDHFLTEGFKNNAEKGINIAKRMIDLSRNIYANDAIERDRLLATYLSKQAKLFVLMRQNEQAILLYIQSFTSSKNIITSYEAINGLVLVNYFAKNELEHANYLIELFKRGNDNPTSEQKKTMLSLTRFYQNMPNYQGQYKDLLNSFFFRTIEIYTDNEKMDLVVRLFNEERQQINTLHFDNYLKQLALENRSEALCLLLSKLNFTKEQCDLYLCYANLFLNQEHSFIAILKNFNHCNHIVSSAVLSWRLVCSPKTYHQVDYALNLAQKALLKSKNLNNPKLQKQVNSIAYQTIARIYDYGLLTDIPGFQQSDTKAFYYYTLSAESGNPGALQDIAIMYRDGQGVQQDLEQADLFLKKSIAQGNTEALMQLPRLYLMRASTHAKERNQLIDEGIIQSLEGITQYQSTSNEPLLGDSNESYLSLAFLYLMKDSKLNLDVNNFYTFNYQDLIDSKQFEENSPKHRDLFMKYLQEAIQRGNQFGNQVLAISYISGVYLEKDLLKAKECIRQLPYGLNRILLSILMNLKKSEEVETRAEKEIYLNKAFEKYNILVSACSSVSNTDLLIHIRTIIEQVKTNSIKSYDNTIVSLFQRRPLSLSENSDRKLELTRIIDEVLLNVDPSQFSKYKIQFLDYVKTIQHLINTMRMSVVLVKNVLPNLYKIQEIASKVIHELSNKDLFTLIGYFQRWPIRNKEAIGKFNFSASLDALTNQKEIAYALLEISYDCSMESINSLRLMLLKKLSVDQIKDPHLLSKLIYCCATQVAGAYLGSDQFLDLARSILKSLDRFVDELFDVDINQLFIAMQYLEIVDSSLLSNLTSLQLLIKEYKKSMNNNSSDHGALLTNVSMNQVTISKQQEKLYRAIQVYFPSVEHEPIIAGRRIDYYIPEKNLVLFYNGPSHYHYNQEGGIESTNVSSKLTEQTVLKAGYAIEVFHFQEYEQYKESLDKLVKEKLKPYLSHQTTLSENQNAWFKKPKATAQGSVEITVKEPLYFEVSPGS